jgi:hypothetical protein
MQFVVTQENSSEMNCFHCGRGIGKAMGAHIKEDVKEVLCVRCYDKILYRRAQA